MQSVPRASVDINQEAPAAQKSNSYTLTINKKVAYALGALALVALATIGVASVSQHGDADDKSAAMAVRGPPAL